MSRGYALLHQATKGFRDPAMMDTFTPTTASCACCQRAWAEVEDPGVAMEYQYSAGYAFESVCTTCYTPRLPATAMLGVEKLARGGKPVGGKLGMLAGSGGVITPSGELHLALPQGWIDKFKDGELGRLGRLHRCGAMALLLKLHSDGALENSHQGFVFVENWGRKADTLMGQWRASFSLSEVWCLSDQGAEPLDLAAMIDVARFVHAEGLAKKAVTPAFWRPIVQAAQGRRHDASLQKWTEALDDPMTLLAALPIDPHSRMRLTPVMRELIPLIEEGAL